MNPVNILVIGRHAQIMETVLRLLNTQPGWRAQGALTDSEAREKFNASAFDLVLIGGGVEEESELKLKQAFTSGRPDIKVIRHYGGGSGLLFNEVQQAVNS